MVEEQKTEKAAEALTFSTSNHAIEKRPALYNKGLKEYSDKILKKTLWLEICQEFIQNWVELGEKEKNEWVPGIRHLQALYSFTGLLVAFLQRLNLSVAVVQMTTSQDFKVELTPASKALVVSSFFWGYGLLQIPLGSIGRRGKAAWLMGVSNLLSGALSLVLPLAASMYGVTGICAVRFFTGLVQGAIFPSIYNLVAKWVIPQEKELVGSFIYLGENVGSVISTIMSGYLGYIYDWPSIFYVTGVIAVVWGVFHILVRGESPEDCKVISAEEKEFMELSFLIHYGEKPTTPAAVPWCSIITSRPVWALIICSWTTSWGGWTIATLTPSFINGVLHLNLQDNGLLSSLPQLCSCVAGFAISFLAGTLKNKSSLPDNILRPFWNSIGMYGSCTFILIFVFVPVNTFWAIALLIGIKAVLTATLGGYVISHFDLSPNFAGVIMAITNTASNTASIFGPLISTYIIKDNGDQEQWRVVFLIAAMLYFVGNTVFIFWCTTKRQPWDDGLRQNPLVAA